MELGTLCRYWKGAKIGEPSGVAKTRSDVQVVCGTKVVFLEGVAGCIALTHVEIEYGRSILTPELIKDWKEKR